MLIFLLLGACLVAEYTKVTPYDSRVHDLDGHLEHVDYIHARKRVPPAAKPLQRLAAVLALGTMLFGVLGAWSFVRETFRRRADGRRPLLIALLGLVAFEIVFGARYPFVSTNDFRYIVPVVIPAASMTAAGAGAIRQRFARRHVHLAALAGGLVIVFAVASLEILLDWT